jgi:hypothetical protein
LLLACPQEFDEELHAPILKESVFTAIEAMSPGLESEAGPVLLEGESIGVRQEDEFEFELQAGAGSCGDTKADDCAVWMDNSYNLYVQNVESIWEAYPSLVVKEETVWLLEFAPSVIIRSTVTEFETIE